MRSLTNDMAQLRSHIDDSRATRLSEHHVRITNVKSQLSDFAISRLSNGIQDARERADFVSNNKKDVKRLVSEFHHSRQTMSRQDRQDRIGFVNDISKDTLTLLADFNNEHKAMAQHTAKVRSDFIAKNKSDVRAFINEASDDRAGAHAAFFGKSHAKKKQHF
jgi:flavorubredoxin